MKIRLVHTALTLALALALIGCNGPTKAGREARLAANTRMDAFNAQFVYNQAKQDLFSGQFDRALAAVDRAIAQLPDAPAFHVLRGRIFLETHRLERAIDSFLVALEKDPGLAEAHYFAGIVFQRWSDDEESFDHYYSAYELAPDNAQYLLAAAEALIALGDFEEAGQLVETKLAYFENNAALHHVLAQIAQLQGDVERAATLFETARALDPDNLMLHEELAWAQYEAGLYGPCLETVRLLQDRLVEPRTDLEHLEARALVVLGRSNDAHAIYSELSRTSPGNPSVWIEFGTVAWELQDFRRLAQCSARAIALAPERFEGYMLKGLYERHQKHPEEATQLLREAAARSTDSALPHLLLGQMLEQMGETQSALEVYREAMERHPDNADAPAFHSALAKRTSIATMGSRSAHGPL